MQIVVNTRLLIKNRLDGIGWFSYQTLKRITQQHKDVHFVFLFDRPYDDEFIFSDNVTPVVLSPQARHPFLYIAWFQFSVRQLLNKMKPDLFLSPDGFLSLGAKCPQLPVIHDLNFKHNPQDVRFLTRYYYNYFFPKFAKEATRIATVSEYSKQDICSSYNIDESKIDVVYNGINESFKPLDELSKEKTKRRFSLGKNYFLFVGSLHPRKNIPRLIQAFDVFKKATKSDFKLLLAGPHLWGQQTINEALHSITHKEDVIFTGRLSDKDLAEITASAYALTFVPYFEGFGIPLIEAMRSEIPIITSNSTSLPEIAGKSALLADPYSVEDIGSKMIEIYKNEALQKQLIEAGKLQQQLFSWDRTADLLWQSILKATNK